MSIEWPTVEELPEEDAEDHLDLSTLRPKTSTGVRLVTLVKQLFDIYGIDIIGIDDAVVPGELSQHINRAMVVSDPWSHFTGNFTRIAGDRIVHPALPTQH